MTDEMRRVADEAYKALTLNTLRADEIEEVIAVVVARWKALPRVQVTACEPKVVYLSSAFRRGTFKVFYDAYGEVKAVSIKVTPVDRASYWRSIDKDSHAARDAIYAAARQ